MKYIYVAGPVGPREGREKRVADAIAAADAIWRDGLWPYLPHLAHFWNELYEHDYEQWMALDFAWLDICDALFRIPGVSPGADREVARAHAAGKPVFTDLGALSAWARGLSTPAAPETITVDGRPCRIRCAYQDGGRAAYVVDGPGAYGILRVTADGKRIG
jgi:hypothetical protein